MSGDGHNCLSSTYGSKTLGLIELQRLFFLCELISKENGISDIMQMEIKVISTSDGCIFALSPCYFVRC